MVLIHTYIENVANATFLQWQRLHFVVVVVVKHDVSDFIKNVVILNRQRFQKFLILQDSL